MLTPCCKGCWKFQIKTAVGRSADSCGAQNRAVEAVHPKSLMLGNALLHRLTSARFRTRNRCLGTVGSDHDDRGSPCRTGLKSAIVRRFQSTPTDFLPRCPIPSDRGTATACTNMQRRAGERRLPSSATLNLHENQPVSMCSPAPLVGSKLSTRRASPIMKILCDFTNTCHYAIAHLAPVNINALGQ